MLKKQAALMKKNLFDVLYKYIAIYLDINLAVTFSVFLSVFNIHLLMFPTHGMILSLLLLNHGQVNKNMIYTIHHFY